MSARLDFLSDLFDALPVGVVVLDRHGRVVHFNRTEERLARRSRERALGRDFFTEVAPCMDVKELAGAFRDGIGRGDLFEQLEISFAFPFLEGPRDVAVYLRSLQVEGEPHAALFIEDVSARRAAERLQRSLAELLRPEAGSPIAGILASCGLLLSEVPDLQGPVLRAVGDVTYEADELQSLLMNLLDVSRLETHRQDIVVGPYPVAPLLRSAVETRERHAAHRGVRFDVGPLDDDLVAMVDAPLMARTLDSLLLTALRQAPAGSAVAVRLEPGAAGPAVVVRDEGEPLTERQLPDLQHHVRPDGEVHDLSYGDREALALTFVTVACATHGARLAVEPSPGGTTYRVQLLAPRAGTPFLGG